MITIEPTIANNKIIDVIINHNKWLEYIRLPILLISDITTTILSQLLEETYEISLFCLLIGNSTE